MSDETKIAVVPDATESAKPSKKEQLEASVGSRAAEILKRMTQFREDVPGDTEEATLAALEAAEKSQKADGLKRGFCIQPLDAEPDAPHWPYFLTIVKRPGFKSYQNALAQAEKGNTNAFDTLLLNDCLEYPDIKEYQRRVDKVPLLHRTVMEKITELTGYDKFRNTGDEGKAPPLVKDLID